MGDLPDPAKKLLIFFILLFAIIFGTLCVITQKSIKEREVQEHQYRQYIDQGYSVYVDGVLAESKAISISHYDIEFSIKDKSVYLRRKN